jgi:hypothetical protein
MLITLILNYYKFYNIITYASLQYSTSLLINTYHLSVMDVSRWRHTYFYISHEYVHTYELQEQISRREIIIRTVISSTYNSRSGKIPSTVEDVANDHHPSVQE